MAERITGTRIKNGLTTLTGGSLVCVASPPVIPDSPDRIVVVTLLPGTGHDHERAFEIRTFQIRCRSIQNVHEQAEADSMTIDTLLNSMRMPWRPDGAHIIELGWTGGGPSPMPADDSANRYSWVCSYYCKAATGY